MFSVILNRSPETEESHYYSSNRSNNPQSTTKNHLIQSKSTIKQPRLIELPRIGDWKVDRILISDCLLWLEFYSPDNPAKWSLLLLLLPQRHNAGSTFCRFVTRLISFSYFYFFLITLNFFFIREVISAVRCELQLGLVIAFSFASSYICK